MDPNVVELAQKIGAFLLPLLPYLLKAGEEADKEAGKKFGGEAWEQAKALWGKLAPNERMHKAAEAAAALPENPAIQQGLAAEIARALEEDPALQGEIARLWGEDRSAGRTVIASGDRSVATGGNVSGSTIVTGDNNNVERA
jgi:hypothetical protein